MAVLGHIDHGKTSLLMAVKDFGVLRKEAGGITQHVGAYQIMRGEKKITFIDTPGHEAFSAIRSRGAKAADIAILVVDSCESVKDQTKEAIKDIKEAQIPMIVALNKTDKPQANPEKAKQDLMQEEVFVEGMGGEVPCVEISAKTGKGIEDLVDMILLVAEVEQLKADLDSSARGVVIEAYLDAKRGPVATLLLLDGNLKEGSIVGTNSGFGKAKGLQDFNGKRVKQVFASDPVIVLGFNEVLRVGEEFKVFESIPQAEANIKKRKSPLERKRESLKDKKVLNIVLKSDVVGSLEAVEQIIYKLPQEKVAVRIVKSEVGNVNETDVKLAKTVKGAVIAFRVKTDKIAQSVSENERVRIYTFDIIYELSQKIRELMEKKLEPENKRIDLGEINVLAIFRTEKNKQIVGGEVIEGKIEKPALLEIYRGEEKVGEGKISTLQINKKEVSEANKGSECAMVYEGKERIKEKDLLKVFRIETSMEGL